MISVIFSDRYQNKSTVLVDSSGEDVSEMVNTFLMIRDDVAQEDLSIVASQKFSAMVRKVGRCESVIREGMAPSSTYFLVDLSSGGVRSNYAESSSAETMTIEDFPTQNIEKNTPKYYSDEKEVEEDELTEQRQRILQDEGEREIHPLANTKRALQHRDEEFGESY